MVLFNAWTIGRDPSMWDEPEEFKPERFLNSSVDFKGHDFQLIPFGAGRRGCPGSLFAMIANEIVLANLVHKFDWTLPGGARAEDIIMTESLSQRHGPLMLLHFGSVPVLVVSSAEAAREILKTHDHAFSDRPKSTIIKKLLYDYKDVASAPYGEYWRQVRSICVLNLLSNRRVRSFRSVREEETKSMIRNIKDSSSSVLNLSEMFVRLTNDVVCRVALGRKYSEGEGGESGRMFKEILGEFTDLLGIVNIGDYVPWLSWLSHVNGLGAKLDKVAKQLDDFIDTVVQEHMNHSSRSGDDDQKDFLDILLAIQKENSAGIPIDRVSVKGIILI
ncbi:PREDICTED: cytochrome P450 71A24-like [Prunus mume]|uniref:Cytochrome P450 71A24-like n=1 Tax=Prunus mume TaxID=102107 RepID=A0ABM1LUK0_PRUMU|nr:PREDICTED: cytochrome P450 71A24-like [Prunus mume]